MEIFQYLGHLGYTGIWFSPGKKQCEQPQKYLKYIIERSYLKYMIEDLLKTSVTFKNGGSLQIINLTELNARSPRADFVVYDEESQAEMDAYRAAVSILTVTNMGFIFHISTPTKGSIFEENYDRLRVREKKTGKKYIFSRKWSDVSYLARKESWYMEEKSIRPPWYFRQEHEASFELPMGAVFQNVQFGAYPDWLLDSVMDRDLCSGLDWNPVSGHWIASIRFDKDLQNIVVMAEHDIGQGYAVEMTNEQWNIIRDKGTHTNRIVMESGGLNEEYTRWIKKLIGKCNYPDQNFFYEEWDAQGINKLQACTWVIQHGICIWCDRDRFPNLAKMIEDCRWDPDATEPKIQKDPANSPHALDAFLHAISKKNREPITYEVSDW